MNISDIARVVGIAPSAVRFYERTGVLPRAHRGPNGYREYDENDLCQLRVVVSLRRLGLDLAVAGRLAALCQGGQCDTMARDLLPLVSAQRSAIARARHEIEELDRDLAKLEVTLTEGDVDADLCLEKGGEEDDRLRLRLRLPVSAYTQLSVLSGH